jgi:hypothetical protein
MGDAMSDPEFLELAWTSSIRRVIAMIEEYSKDWQPNGPSMAVATAILNKIRAMPVPRS